MNKSFTLIEILVVIVVIGIISSFIIIGLSSFSDKANISKLQVFSNSIRNSLMLNIMAEWKFDDVSGVQTKDNWSNNLTGTLSNFTDTSAGYGDNNSAGWMSSKNCISGTCLKLDVGQWVSVASAFPGIGNNSFSFEAWGKTDSTGDTNHHAIIYLSVSGITNWLGRLDFPYSTSSRALMFVRSSCYRYSAKYINDNKWHHVIGVFDRSKTTPDIYVDGKLDNGSSSNSECSTVGSIPSGTIWLVYNSFKGSVDEIRIYNEIVPAFQVKQNYFIGLNNLFLTNSINYLEYKNNLAEL
jgi:prepilin-type N-terminal cleavage/methylation domain-containing protein